jgi:hypothetical protein
MVVMQGETPLEMGRRHIATNERLIAEQKEMIERLRAQGHATDEAEGMLRTLKRTLVSLHRHQALEEQKSAE